MAQAVNVNFKLDADVKKSMEQACSELGLSMSAAFTIFGIGRSILFREQYPLSRKYCTRHKKR